MKAPTSVKTRHTLFEEASRRTLLIGEEIALNGPKLSRPNTVWPTPFRESFETPRHGSPDAFRRDQKILYRPRNRYGCQ
jgi:hypothetical protein